MAHILTMTEFAAQSDEELKTWLKEDPKHKLFAELYISERLARKGGKGKTNDTHMFQANLYDNLLNLTDALWESEYKPSRGTAHVIFNPVIREIVAAPYVDRVVHQYVVNAIDPWWEPRLNEHSYSCRVNRGTSFGIYDMRRQILRASHNMMRRVYVVKLDIRGYFMHINREIMRDRVLWGLKEYRKKMPELIAEKEYEILKHAITEIIMDDPIDGIKIEGSYEDWRNLPPDKSLFCQPKGRGIVIGNYTSQSFSNIYLDMLDRFVTIELGYHYYGRYVDDFYVIVAEDQLEQVKRDIKVIDAFLNGIGLSLNQKKTRVIPAEQGVPFLGMVIKGHAILPGRRVAGNFSQAAYKFAAGDAETPIDSIVSYMGMLKNYDSGKKIEKIFENVGWDYNW